MSRGADTTDRPWFWPVMTLLVACIFFISVSDAYHTGFDKGVKQERDAKAEHDKFMRDLGTCRWAEMMAERIQCKRPE